MTTVTTVTGPERLSPLALSPRQIQAIVESGNHRVSILHGAVRSGKTVSSLVAFLIALVQMRELPGLVVLVARTLQTAERNVIEPLQDPTVFGPVAEAVAHTRGANTANVLGQTVHIIGANDVRAEGKLRGLTAKLIYVDEATLVAQDFFTQALARLSVEGARLIATTNPDSSAHWLRRDYLLRAAELDLGHWHFAITDNPGLPAAFVNQLRHELVGLWYRRHFLGEWCAAEGAIYDMFDADRHVVDALPLIQRWLALGVDYGTVNPFCGELLGVGVDGRLYVCGELWYDSRTAHQQKTDSQYSRDLGAWLDAVAVPGTDPPIVGVRPEWTCVDPSAASFIRQVHLDGQLTPTPARNSVIDGIRLVASLLGQDRLRVHRSCRWLTNELPAYAWDERAAKAGVDAPVKVDDHAVDALRYAVATTEAAWRPMLNLPTAGGGERWLPGQRFTAA